MASVSDEEIEDLLDRSERPDDLLERAKVRLAEMDAKLSPEQRRAVPNLAVFGFVPQFFYTERLRLRELPDDRTERAALLSGLEALARV
jgi:hypothetical protein